MLTPVVAQAAELDVQLGGPLLIVVNLLLASIMFGVGLDLDLAEFRRTLSRPVGPVVGLATQFLALPALAFAFVSVLDLAPAIAVGVIVVSSCPGGTTSNIITHLAGANTSLSIAMTGVSTLLALVMTPLNISFWGGRLTGLGDLEVQVDALGLVLTLVLVIGLPVAVGAWVQVRRHRLADRLRRPMRIVAVVALVVLVVGAVGSNLGAVGPAMRSVLPVVVAMNVLALVLGYGAAALMRRPVADRQAISIEVGIQNTALALALVLQLFGDQAEAILVAALYGAWHLVSGLTLARVWSGQPLLGRSPTSG